MRRIGLTGGIGSGKSTVAAHLAQLGATVIDSDLLAREVVEPGTPGLAAVVERFGPDVLTAEGTLDRPKLGSIVFADPAALTDLNAIVHPLVGARTVELTTAAGDEAVLVFDIPLLAENGRGGDFDEVVVVETPLELRLERLVGRGMDGDTARARIAVQATDEQRREVATILLHNGGTLADLNAQVDAAWPRLNGAAVPGA